MHKLTSLVICLGVFLLIGQSCNNPKPQPVEQKVPENVDVENTIQTLEAVQQDQTQNNTTAEQPTTTSTTTTGQQTNKPVTNPTVKPVTKPITPQYDANGFPIHPTQMQKFVHSNGETYYYVDGTWTHEDYVYPYQDQNPVLENPAVDVDSLNFSDNSSADPNACSPEGASYSANDTTYYCIDGIWTMSDYVFPYQNY